MRKTVACLLGILVIAFAVVGCETKNNVTPRDGAVKGTIVDRGDVPISGAEVAWTQDPKFAASSDSSGNFYIDGVNFGEQTFSVTKSGFVAKTFSAVIYANYVIPVGKVVLATSSFTITDVKAESVSATSADLSWKTSEFTNGLVEFGETDTLGQTAREASGSYATLHKLSVTNLKPSTRYFFRISATKQLQSTEVSATSDFTTLSAKEDTVPPSAPKSIEVNMTEKPNQVTITWSPNSETDLEGYKIYRSETALAGFEDVTNGIIAKGQERYIDAGILAGTKYYYRVTAVDEAGNEGGSSDIVSILVPGDIARKVIWSRAHNPYYLVGDLDVQSTGVLEIEPGVEVRVADYDALQRGDSRKVEIRVVGTLSASGSEAFPITLTSAKPIPGAGDWGGVFFNRAQKGFNAVHQVTIAHADCGLKLFQTSGTFSGAFIQDCSYGVVASQSQELTIASFTVRDCPVGMLMSGNRSLTIASNSVFAGEFSLVSSGNDTMTISGNDFLEFSDIGVSTQELQGTILVENNLFVSATGVGLHIVDKRVQVLNNTFDAGTAIRVDKNSPTIQKNMLVGSKSVLSDQTKGIEYLTEVSPLYEFGPNNVYGFPSGNDHVGCASTATSLSQKPLFMKDAGGTEYDYRLRQGIPSSESYWGIIR
jgi:hypothetical protein